MPMIPARLILVVYSLYAVWVERMHVYLVTEDERCSRVVVRRRIFVHGYLWSKTFHSLNALMMNP